MVLQINGKQVSSKLKMIIVIKNFNFVKEI